jgi:hypothetical protein
MTGIPTSGLVPLGRHGLGFSPVRSAGVLALELSVKRAGSEDEAGAFSPCLLPLLELAGSGIERVAALNNPAGDGDTG